MHGNQQLASGDTHWNGKRRLILKKKNILINIKNNLKQLTPRPIRRAEMEKKMFKISN
jgi:hypothetical protein